MSDETTAPAAAPQTVPTEAPKPTRPDYVSQARAHLEAREQPAAPPAEAPPAATPETQDDTSFADAVLGGAPPAAKKEDEAPPLDATDPNLARIVELDRALREERRSLDEERRKFAEERTRVDAWAKAHDLAQSGKRLDALAALGIDYADLTQEALGATGGSKEYADRIAELEAKLEELPKTYEQKLAEAEQKRQEEQLNTWHAEQERIVTAAGERWELLRDHAGQLGKRTSDLIVDVMERAYNEGRTLTPEQAADTLERALEKRVRERATPTSKYARLLQLTSAPSVPMEQAPPNAGRTGHQAMTPLPSTVTASAASESTGPLPEDRSPEGYKRAAMEVAARALRNG
jgi:hypothetical protein